MWGGEVGGVWLKSTLIETWPEREGVSCILQFEREGDRDGSARVMSMIVEYLWLEKVG